MKDDDDTRRQAWSAYWAQGALHSCTGSFDARYSGAIGDFWDTFFADLAQEERVLDLATGNGALPQRLWEREGTTEGLRIDAVDLAALAPPWYRPDVHRGITFRSGVAMEALPYPDGTFDRVTSQFGLEYARRPEALSECVRVSRPGGSLAFVLHHAGSVLASVGRVELENQASLLAPDGLLVAARRVLPWIARARANAVVQADAARATRDRDAYNQAMARLAANVAASAVPDALVEARDHVHGLVAGVTAANLEASIESIDAYAEAMRSAALRTREMLEHALDPAQVTDMSAYFESARPGCEVRYAPLVQREGVLAWGFVVSPAESARTSSNGPSAPE